jgi:hypothetical protein
MAKHGKTLYCCVLSMTVHEKNDQHDLVDSRHLLQQFLGVPEHTFDLGFMPDRWRQTMQTCGHACEIL